MCRPRVGRTSAAGYDRGAPHMEDENAAAAGAGSKTRAQTASGLREALQALPKVDLHRHLEGSLRLSTLAEIAGQHGVDLPGCDIEELRPLVTARDDEPDFHRFLRKFEVLRRFYCTQEAVERVAYEAVADAAGDNVRYLELRFNPVALARAQSFPLDDVTTWVCMAVAKSAADRGIEAKLILQIGRDETLKTAAEIAEVALAHREDGVVGLDLAGDEVKYPAAPFSPIFRAARQDGLNVTVHAGEAGGAANVREAIELLGAQRIGHGLRTIDDQETVELVRTQQTTLEVCPTSNLQTGVVDSLSSHPLPLLLNQGIRATINTDDPSVSDTTLTDEYLTAALAMEITTEQIKETILDAVRGSFQPQGERETMLEWFKSELRLDE
ncbi:MAG: adenosine deaminase [Anaerolineales bacterium]|nr:MAG: adenosine deaminase [Anaerolineales bacterium]